MWQFFIYVLMLSVPQAASVRPVLRGLLVRPVLRGLRLLLLLR